MSDAAACIVLSYIQNPDISRAWGIFRTPPKSYDCPYYLEFYVTKELS